MKKSILTLLLVGVICGLGYILVTNIKKPIDFTSERDAREDVVVERLKEIRALQVAYQSMKGQYTSSFDSLENFYKTGQMQTIVAFGSMDDSVTVARTNDYEKRYQEQQRLIKARRPIRGERLVALADLDTAQIAKLNVAVRKAVSIAVKDAVAVDNVLLSSKANFNIDDLRYVPTVSADESGKRPIFEMEAKFKEVSKIQIPLFEARVSNDVYLQGLDKQEIINLNHQQSSKTVNNYPGLKVGDINNPNNNAGNWE